MSATWSASTHHLGRVVVDIHAAMAQLTADYGVTWEPLRRYDLDVLDEGRSVQVPMAVALSADAPLLIELFEEAPGTPWTRGRGDPIHHVCYWVPDTVAEAERLMANGWRLEVTAAGPDQINGFCYLIGPDGLRVEPKGLAETAPPGVLGWQPR